MITFIIPTIGRSTLTATLKSLYNQTDENWRAIVVFDGIPCNIDRSLVDSRVEIMEIEKAGCHTNCAGFVRNAGIRNCSSEWVAFLDDDDLASSRYVETFYNEICEYKFDVVIFRMYLENRNSILPLLDTDNFYHQKVGISFAVKTSLFKDRGIWFQPSDCEDFDLLNNLRNNGVCIMISPFIRYFVRIVNTELIDNFTNDFIMGNRLFIGMHGT